jgi:hypothetical protein
MPINNDDTDALRNAVKLLEHPELGCTPYQPGWNAGWASGSGAASRCIAGNSDRHDKKP